MDRLARETQRKIEEETMKNETQDNTDYELSKQQLMEELNNTKKTLQETSITNKEIEQNLRKVIIT